MNIKYPPYKIQALSSIVSYGYYFDNEEDARVMIETLLKDKNILHIGLWCEGNLKEIIK